MTKSTIKNTPNPTSSGSGEGKHDLIDGQAAIDALRSCQTYLFNSEDPDKKVELRSAESAIDGLPAVQPVAKDINVLTNDCISRQAAIDAVEKAKMAQTPDGEIFVAKYNAEMNIQLLPPVQPVLTCKGCSNDCISRKAAMLALDTVRIQGNDSWYTYYQKALNAMIKLPAVQPDLSEYSDKLWKSAYERGKAEAEDAGWIPCSKRLPAVPCCRCLITRDNGRGETTVEEALFSFGKWYDNEWLEDGHNRKFDISTSVIAWAPFPAPYRGGEK